MPSRFVNQGLIHYHFHGLEIHQPGIYLTFKYNYFIQDQVPGVHKVPAEATYLAWLDFRETGLKQDEIMDRLVNVGGVGLYSGTEFGEEGIGFFRMNIACARSQLDHGLDGIRRAIA